jgi:sn-glycerol 3-phosphate transport system ATP-binding protein/multiple sugar transport system ATP-binding protein
VTHDQVEAMTLADVMFVLNKGVVEQAGSPLEIYARPATRFVAGFMGMPAMNFFEGTLTPRGTGWVVAADGVTAPVDAARFADALAAGRGVTAGVRPHDVRIAKGGEGAPLDVTLVEALGMESFAHGELGGAPFVARVEADAGVKKGDRIHLEFATLHLFDAGTGASLRA